MITGSLLLFGLLLGFTPQDKIVVGSKNFEESRLLAEVFAQWIEARTDLVVERKLNLAGTQVCFEALRSRAIDLYPEYTGTGLVVLLGEEPGRSQRETLNYVRSEFLRRWDLVWLSPLGFENAYELAVPKELARQSKLRTISDLIPVAEMLKAGFGFEFIERKDGLRGLSDAYGIQFMNVQPMQQALKYQAAGKREIECLDVYTTDGRLLVHDLVVLEDDLDFFPPYEAAALVHGETLRRHPELGNALALLAGSLDEEWMRHFNLRLQEGKEAVGPVATDLLGSLGLLELASPTEPVRTPPSAWQRVWADRSRLLTQTLEHLGLASLGVSLAALVAIPLGLYLERRRKIAEACIRAIGISQTIPSLALLAFMIPLLGIGIWPAIVALWIYALFPILRNTYTGVREASPAAVESAEALGMTRAQVLRQVRLPLAVPVILAGVRTAAVITMGTATLAAFIGAGGLGVPILTGLQLADHARILSGAIPAALLALLVDAILALIERRYSPPGHALRS